MEAIESSKAGHNSMNRRHLAYGFVFVELLIQIMGGLYYDQTPAAIWSFANGVLLLAPLLCGMGIGLLCFLPAAVSELVWYSQLHTLGPLLHVASFAVAVVALALASERLRQEPLTRQVAGSLIVFLLALIAEEALYYALRTLFLQRSMAWAKVFETALSPAILPLVVILIACCLYGTGQQERHDR